MSASREKKTPRADSQARTAREAQQRKEEQKTNLLFGLIAAGVAIAVIASIIWRSDFIPRSKTAATIDGEKYSIAEVAYNYRSAYSGFVNNYSYFVSYLGLDTSSSLKSQEISADTAAMLGIEGFENGAEDNADAESQEEVSTGITWHDYFLDEALKNIATIQAALKKADAEGFQYPASVQAQYDESMASLKSAAAASGLSVSRYLKSSFGSGVNEKIYGEQYLKALKYSAYAKAYKNGLTYSESELEAAYDGDRNTYDQVSYEIVSFSGTAPSTTDADGNTVEPTEEESAAALEEARENANAVLEEVRAGTSLETAAENHDGTYNIQENGTYNSGNVTSEWLFNSARRADDSAVLEDGTILYVVVFHDRFRDVTPTIDVRHILVPLGTATLTSDDEGYEEEQAQLKADAHARAEELLAQWQNGEATEDSFAALAMKESTDGNKYDGGIYTEVYEGRMVADFNDWCFDSSRKAGDTGVVDTQYGSHVMYFVGVDPLNRWQSQVAQTLRSEDYANWNDELAGEPNIQRDESGLKYIG